MPSSATPFADGTLARKLMWYGAAAGLTGLAASDAQAQIIYRDINPDITVQNTAGIPLDMDNDGDPEILLRESTTSNGSFINHETTLGTDDWTGIVGATSSGYTYITPMAAGAPISAATIFTPTRLFASFTYDGGGIGTWVGTEAYLGIRFTLGANVHYGWVRVQFPAAGQYIVKDLAYNSTPNAAINAGQGGGVAVEPGALAEGYLFSELAPNPVAARSTFQLAVGRAEHVRIDVLDVSGRQVATVLDQTIPGNEIRRVAFDASALPSGVYVMRVTGESFVTTRRVTVAH